MNILLQITMSVLGLMLLLAILVLSQVLRQVRNVTVRRGRVAARERCELPAHLEAAYATGEAELRALGFVYSHCELVAPPLAAGDVHTWMLAYRYPGERCTASITAPAIPDPRVPYQVTFAARYSDGTLLTTVNGQAHQIVPGMERLILVDAYAPDLTRHWQAHREAMARLRDKGERELYENAKQSIEAHQRFLDDYVGHLQKLGALEASGPETYRFRLLPALRLALQLLKGAVRVIGMRRRQRAAGTTTTPEAEMEGYRRMEALMRRRSAGWITKMGLFAVSVVLFILAFALSLSVHTVLILVGILLFHELGHVLGMRLFGYRDVQVLFLPFLGAVALADEPDVPAYQRVIVYLLGPLPGLALGYGLLMLYHHTGERLLYETALIALTVNYFNLLPIIPLDGGQVLNVVLFERWPRAQVAFLALSTAAAIAGGWLLGSPVLWLLAMLLLIVLSTEVRKAGAWSRLKAQLRSLPRSIGEAGDDAALLRVLAVLREPPHGRLSFPRRFHIARELLRHSRHRPATLPVAGTSLAVYACALILPLWMLYGGMLLPTVVAPPAPHWDELAAAAPGAEERWKVYLEAGDWYADAEDEELARGYYAKAVELARGFGELDPRLAESLVHQASAAHDIAQARGLYVQALAIQEKVLGREHPAIAGTLEHLALTYYRMDDGEDDGGDLARAIELQQRAVRLREHVSGAPDPEPDPDLADSLRQLANLYEARGQLAQAEAELMQAVDVERSYAGKQPSRLADALQGLAELHLRHGNYEKAQAPLEQAVAAIAQDKATGKYMLPRVESTLGWVRLLRGDPVQAREWFLLAINHQEKTSCRPERNLGVVPLALDLAYLYVSQGDYAAARPYVERAGRIVAATERLSLAQHAARLRAGMRGAAAQPPTWSPPWPRLRNEAHAKAVRAMLSRKPDAVDPAAGPEAVFAPGHGVLGSLTQ